MQLTAQIWRDRYNADESPAFLDPYGLRVDLKTGEVIVLYAPPKP